MKDGKWLSEVADNAVGLDQHESWADTFGNKTTFYIGRKIEYRRGDKCETDRDEWKDLGEQIVEMLQRECDLDGIDAEFDTHYSPNHVNVFVFM